MEIKNVEMIESLDRAISSYMNTCVNKLMVCVLCTLWMLEGPQTLIEATVGTPRFDRPIWTPRKDVPTVEAQTQHRPLVGSDLLKREDMALSNLTKTFHIWSIKYMKGH